MRIQKRNGKYQQMSFDKIKARNNKLANDISLGKIKNIDTDLVSQKVIQQITDGISAEELDILSADICISMSIDNPSYGDLASRIYTNNLQKIAPKTFVESMEELYKNDIINKDFIEDLRKNKENIEDYIVHNRDYLIDYFGLKTLEKGYLLNILSGKSKKLMETPQYMWMRVALALHGEDLERVFETYDNLSLKNFTHATPTLFNAGTNRQQLSSCYLVDTEDSISGIFKTMGDIAQISKYAGGVGLTCSRIRAKDSIIRGTNGKSDGILPMLKVYNEIARYVNQAGKRNGSFACFVKDTKVFTDNGVKNIQDVNIGDMVVTHENRLKPVLQVHKNKLGDRKIYKLSAKGNKDIFVTGNHKFLSFYTKKSKDKRIDYGWNSVEKLKELMENKKTTKQGCYITVPCGNSIKQNFDKIDILSYKNIILETITELIYDDNDYIIPITKSYNAQGYKTLSRGNSIKRFWDIDVDLAKLYGIWLGDGCIKHKNDYPLGIQFTVNGHNTKLINFIKETCEAKFGIKIEESMSKKSNCANIQINSSIIGIIFKELFSSGFSNKKLPPTFFKWSTDLVEAFIAGLISTDGHVTSKKQFITLGLSNKNLMEQIFHLCRNNGIVCTYLSCGNIDKKILHYTISIPKNKNILSMVDRYYKDGRMEMIRIHKSDNQRFLNIISIEETDIEDEYVYTLGVKDDHSYTVEGVVVENCFLDVFHADIEEFLEMKKNTGDANLRARDLFYGLWVSDLFMEKVEKDEDWFLMCPDQCKGLVDAYGEDFNILYMSYIEKGMYRKKIRARDLWNSILVSQTETGTPYIGYKDSVNKKNNQSNLGTITSSNLCVAPETMILTDTGYHKIKSLQDKPINIWNGEKFTQTVVRKTGEKQNLIKVNFSNGSILECTKYHKFYIEGGNGILKLDAQELRPGMALIKTDFPRIIKGAGYKSTDFVHLTSSLEDKTKWLHKVFNGSLHIETENLEFINNVKYVLQSIGYDPDVIKEGIFYKLYIQSYAVFSNETKNTTKKHNIIESVEDYGRISDTYCFKEEERGMGIFNGVITGNCMEIMLHHTSGQYAVCNITSICLGNCVENGEFNFEKLGHLAKISTINLNRVIDLNFYPTTETLNSNLAHRPIAIGVQGLYDAFIKLRLPFTSPQAKELNKKIFECIQFNALQASCELAKREGYYSSFKGSPSSKGIFQHNMWNIDEKELNYDWESLRKDVVEYGLRNSLVTALPPTASTANIMGNTSSFETITSNIFTRTVLSGNFPIVNKYLVNDLMKLNLWSLDIKDKIISANGSVQGIPEIPKELKELYKTTWETSQKDTIDMSADRSPFIDHSQSLNIFLANATIAKLSSMHFYGWKRGLKTGSYYIRSQPISGAEKITVQNKPSEGEALACSIDNKEACAMCEG
jgi:ribonucleotide reductase alpha subunit